MVLPSRSNSKWSLNPLFVTLLPANFVSMVTIINVGESTEVKKLSPTMSPQRLSKWSQYRKTGIKFKQYFELDFLIFKSFCTKFKSNCYRVKQKKSISYIAYYDIIQPIRELLLFPLGSYRMPGCPGRLYWISSQW